MKNMNEETIKIGARYCRISVIQNFVNAGFLSEENAKELLKEKLSPNGPDSIVDDSHLINNPEEVSKLKKELLFLLEEEEGSLHDQALELGLIVETMTLAAKAAKAAKGE